MSDNTSTGLDLESARAFVADVTDAHVDGGGGTHWAGCHTEHPRCAALMGARNMMLLLAEVERLRANDDALKDVCALAAAALMQFEFGDHEREEEALTQRLIDALAIAAGKPRVDALLDDRTETT